LLLEDKDPIGASGTSDEWMVNTGIILDFIGGDALMNVGLVEQIIDYFQQRVWETNGLEDAVRFYTMVYGVVNCIRKKQHS
jgi:hypothetical protein